MFFGSCPALRYSWYGSRKPCFSKSCVMQRDQIGYWSGNFGGFVPKNSCGPICEIRLTPKQDSVQAFIEGLPWLQ
jgi:hypothetical protein